MPAFPLFPGFLSPPAIWRANSVVNTADDDDPDMSYSGPLESILETTGVSAFSTTTTATGRASTPVIAGRSLQLDSYVEDSNLSGLSYLATGQGSALAFQSSTDDDSLAWEESNTEPVPPGSITTGGLSLTNLLSGPDALTQPDPAGTEQVAELVPLPESSLALAATLWTVPSDSSTPPLRWHSPVEAATNANARAGAMSSWMLFVAGVDEALEQTCRELQENMPTSRGGSNDRRPQLAGRVARMARPDPAGRSTGDAEAQTNLPKTRRGQSDGVSRARDAPSRASRSANSGRWPGRGAGGDADDLGRLCLHSDRRLGLAETQQQWRPSNA